MKRGQGSILLFAQKQIPYKNMPNQLPKISIILLAAGASSRMNGRDKLLEKIDGIPLLSRIETACLNSQAYETIVVLPPDNAQRASLISPRAKPVFNPDWQNGMASSLRFGLGQVDANSKAAMVVLADMPDVETQHIDLLIRAFQQAQAPSIIRASSEIGKPGHPVLFDRAFFGQLAKMSGDTGARDFLKAQQNVVQLVVLPGTAANTDLDSPDDWARYHALRQPLIKNG